MSKKIIEDFLAQMRESRASEIEAIELPDGSDAYIAERVAAGDAETLTFMLKLGYLMGLHTGYAAQRAVDEKEAKPGALEA